MRRKLPSPNAPNEETVESPPEESTPAQLSKEEVDKICLDSRSMK